MTIFKKIFCMFLISMASISINSCWQICCCCCSASSENSQYTSDTGQVSTAYTTTILNIPPTRARRKPVVTFDDDTIITTHSQSRANLSRSETTYLVRPSREERLLRRDTNRLYRLSVNYFHNLTQPQSITNFTLEPEENDDFDASNRTLSPNLLRNTFLRNNSLSSDEDLY